MIPADHFHLYEHVVLTEPASLKLMLLLNLYLCLSFVFQVETDCIWMQSWAAMRCWSFSAMKSLRFFELTANEQETQTAYFTYTCMTIAHPAYVRADLLNS